MKTRLFFFSLTAACLLSQVPQAHAWGQAGHGLVGKAALAQVSPAARAAVLEILGLPADGEPGTALDAALEQACNWPDTLRAAGDEPASSPLHYVNLPRDDARYDRQRDCPDGICVTEGILRFAAELGRPELDRERRWRAFAWLCHLVGDLHQPLHVGFRDDRGGNRVMVTYRGESYNLHQFWDDVLEKERMGEAPLVAGDLLVPGGEIRPWEPAEVRAWTDESHALALTESYPTGTGIDDAFADRAWQLVQCQWSKAAQRLASILDTVFSAAEAPAGR